MAPFANKWASLGWERSFLGYPLTDETGTPDGVGRYNHFQGGSVYWTPGTGALRSSRRHSRQVGRNGMGAVLPRLSRQRRGWDCQPRARTSMFQRGSITWTPATGPVPNPFVLHFTAPLTCPEPLGGSVDIVMNSAGGFIFSGHLHNSSVDNIDYTLSAVIIAPNGTGIAFQRSGHTEGVVAGLPFGTPDRDDNFTKPDFNQRISDHWDEFTQASLYKPDLVGTDTLVEGAGKILNDLADQALKALGSAASQALVALVFA